MPPKGLNGKDAVLVTGGAGYVGSHTVRALLQTGRRPIVVDDLSSGHRETVPSGVPFFQADIADFERIVPIIREQGVRAILHFASLIQVGESVVAPKKYWHHNFGKTLRLLDAALEGGVEQVILSSSAAVYGNPVRTPIDEDHPTVPINPYGETKLAVEKVLASYHAAYGLRWFALRYFNAAGAEPDAGLGERHSPETHLIPLTIDAAHGGRPLTVFGSDFDTPDGTCIRDYVHVSDLADAHVAALDAPGCDAINLGTGTGRSVKEVLDTVSRMSGRNVPHRVGDRRAGDPPILVASNERAGRVLEWKPRRDFETIIGDALTFYRSQALGGGNP